MYIQQCVLVGALDQLRAQVTRRKKEVSRKRFLSNKVKKNVIIKRKILVFIFLLRTVWDSRLSA